MPLPKSASDPRPLPPNRPDIEDCCRGGCEVCVFDFYEEEIERYRLELAAWEKRRGKAEPAHRAKAGV